VFIVWLIDCSLFNKAVDWLCSGFVVLQLAILWIEGRFIAMHYLVIWLVWLIVMQYMVIWVLLVFFLTLGSTIILICLIDLRFYTSQKKLEILHSVHMYPSQL
jgi:hypothetical protein